jgi:hypothetical protein
LADYVDQDLLQVLLEMLEKEWFLDCREGNNLRFAAYLCSRQQASHLLGTYFHASIDAYSRQYAIF